MKTIPRYIDIGPIRLTTEPDGQLAVEHRSRNGALKIRIPQSRLERWALRLLRDEALGAKV